LECSSLGETSFNPQQFVHDADASKMEGLEELGTSLALVLCIFEALRQSDQGLSTGCGREIQAGMFGERLGWILVLWEFGLYY
jgi:hypothetical protein